MKKFFTTTLIAILAVSALCFAGCNKTASVSNDAIVDDLGRAITIAKNPQRIIALTSSSMEQMFNIGLGEKLVAKVEEYEIREEGKKLPSIGNQNTPNFEKIAELKPDFIIANTRKHGKSKKILTSIPNSIVYFFDPGKLENGTAFTDTTSRIAKVLGREKESLAYEKKMINLGKQLSKSILEKNQNIKTGVFIEGTAENFNCAQPGSGYGSILDFLDIKNIVPTNAQGASKNPWVKYSDEKLIQANPDIVIIFSKGCKTKESIQNKLQNFKKSKKFNNLKAGKENQIFIVAPKVNPNKQSAEQMLKSTAKTIIDNLK